MSTIELLNVSLVSHPTDPLARIKGKDTPPSKVGCRLAPPGTTVFVSYPAALSNDHAVQIKEELVAALAETGIKSVVLDRGAEIVVAYPDDALARIEEKLDTLIAALAEDEDEAPTHDLDGNPVRPPDQGYTTL